MRYLTTSVWALAAVGGAWLAYDHHVGVVDSYDAAVEELAESAVKLDSAVTDNILARRELAIANETIDGLIPKPVVNPDPLDTTVKVLLKGGHGSGTHIGNGFIVTAGHVANEVGEMNKVMFENGDTYEVETLWTSLPDHYDVALLRITRPLIIELNASESTSDIKIANLPASNLDCRIPERGEEIRLFGNPKAYEFAVTYGHVSGGVRDFGEWWAEAIPVDAASAPGSSGGGMFDNYGNLIGILVGTEYHDAGRGTMDRISYGLNVVIPGKTICNLMGRS